MDSLCFMLLSLWHFFAYVGLLVIRFFSENFWTVIVDLSLNMIWFWQAPTCFEYWENKNSENYFPEFNVDTTSVNETKQFIERDLIVVKNKSEVIN